MVFFCAVLDTCAVWSCLRLKAPASPQARRLLRAYVATQRTLAPAGTEKTHETPNNKKKDRKNGRGWCKGVPLLRIGRRIAPCLLCVDTCAMWSCLRLKATASPQARRLAIAYCATHHDCHHTSRHSAIPLCQYSAAHVHFAPTPDYHANKQTISLLLSTQQKEI